MVALEWRTHVQCPPPVRHCRSHLYSPEVVVRVRGAMVGSETEGEDGKKPATSARNPMAITQRESETRKNFGQIKNSVLSLGFRF